MDLQDYDKEQNLNLLELGVISIAKLTADI